ncbi:MAG: trypsin-like peptidase domain-containing protein [Proteobacteria bacterium]|nr:trypsin-like peptidase domain-containing protein [Pseudomonadota bacterium]
MKANIPIKQTTIPLLAIFLLILAGCDERVSNKSTETAASSVPVVTAKEPTLEEKFVETKKKAEAGNAEAQYSLGEMYFQDKAPSGPWEKYQEKTILTKENMAHALEWFQKAANQGNVDAQFNLAVMYIQGNGCVSDSAKAVEWLEKSAVKGHAEAQLRLGMMYEHGAGIPQNMAQAILWYQKAAAQNNADAQLIIGNRYELGLGLPSSIDKANEWYQKAAAQGNALAQFRLGFNYMKGDGLPKDAVKAMVWLQKSAAQGESNAQANLGILYELGLGVNKDMILAYAWSNLAAGQGIRAARVNRDNYESQLTPEQLTEGQRLASNWKKGDILQSSSDSAAGATSPDGKPTKQSTGTAFAVSNEGHALTNHHVINGCSEVKIAGREGIVKVITSDSVNDLALLQLPGKANDIANLNPDLGKLRQGDDIIVFGYPLNWVLSSGGNLTPGTISALTGLGNNTNQIQITAPIQPGSSGSPVMDKKGNVVGVVSMKLSDTKMVKSTGSVGQNVNFAVNGQTVKSFLDANKVPYKTGGGFFSREKSNADIAEEARKSTMLIECWK